jgi:hypothetical protein
LFRRSSPDVEAVPIQGPIQPCERAAVSSHRRAPPAAAPHRRPPHRAVARLHHTFNSPWTGTAPGHTARRPQASLQRPQTSEITRHTRQVAPSTATAALACPVLGETDITTTTASASLRAGSALLSSPDMAMPAQQVSSSDFVRPPDNPGMWRTLRSPLRDCPVCFESVLTCAL